MTLHPPHDILKALKQNAGRVCTFGQLARARMGLLVIVLFCVTCSYSHAQFSTSSQAQATTPHPAVVRVIVPHYRQPGDISQVDTSLGTGTLIAKKTNYGFVITNWHVVSESNGYVKVRFPNKQQYEAAVVAVDDRWDLALLIISEPKGVEPIAISKTIPQIGEMYSVAGYGSDGTYRVHTGRFGRFKQPEGYAAEPEFIEIDAPSENGDSGGPVFNAKYELAGVLFGSDEITTVASHCGRVIKFLEQAAPHVASLPPAPEAVIKAASISQESILQRGGNTVVPARPNALPSAVSSSTSFGGGGSLRGNQQQLQRIHHTGFMKLPYNIAAGNALLATEKQTPVNPPIGGLSNSTSNGMSTGSTASGGLLLSGANATASPATASPMAATPRENYTNSYPSASAIAGAASESASRVVQPLPRSNVPEPNRVSVGTNNAVANAVTSPPETIPSSVTPLAVSSPIASPNFNPSMNNQTVSRTTTVMPVPSPASSTRSPTAAYDTTSYQPQPESTFGGVRAPSETPPRGTNAGSSSRGTPPTGYNTYSSNTSSPSSSTTGGFGGYGSLSWSDNDAAARYALDAADMQADDYVQKYADEYTTDPIGTVITGAGSKYDAIKIVIAILVIFFILFHTIKTMAIAEERQQATR